MRGNLPIPHTVRCFYATRNCETIYNWNPRKLTMKDIACGARGGVALSDFHASRNRRFPRRGVYLFLYFSFIISAVCASVSVDLREQTHLETRDDVSPNKGDTCTFRPRREIDFVPSEDLLPPSEMFRLDGSQMRETLSP